MKNERDRRISNQFGCFCSRVLKNEAYNIYAEYERRKGREKPFGELTNNELLQMASEDKYFNDEYVFHVLDKEIVVIGNLLAKALQQLPQHKRDVILLSYFAGMSDTEIGRCFHTIQQTISKRRKSTLKLLRDYFEKEGLEWDDM